MELENKFFVEENLTLQTSRKFENCQTQQVFQAKSIRFIIGFYNLILNGITYCTPKVMEKISNKNGMYPFVTLILPL